MLMFCVFRANTNHAVERSEGLVRKPYKPSLESIQYPFPNPHYSPTSRPRGERAGPAQEVGGGLGR